MDSFTFEYFLPPPLVALEKVEGVRTLSRYSGIFGIWPPPPTAMTT
jgi:hypothetical protein